MTPDKIYIFQDGDELWYKPEEWETPPPHRVEYFRKDALLEWAKDMKAETEGVIKQHPEDESLWAEMHWWEVVMEKINAM